ncbi:hypothetical protein MKX03_021428 [Papaver bracteatum]|nr:hypothetical protein MKX03_021428 [Papaver bracteatum]
MMGIYEISDLRSIVPGTSRKDMLREDGLNLMPHHLEDSSRHMGWPSDSNQYVKFDPAMRIHVLVNKISQFFMSSSSGAAREDVNFYLFFLFESSYFFDLILYCPCIL